jgi:hypothetical protein
MTAGTEVPDGFKEREIAASKGSGASKPVGASILSFTWLTTLRIRGGTVSVTARKFGSNPGACEICPAPSGVTHVIDNGFA